MADRPADHDAPGDPVDHSGGEPDAGRPRWVKVFTVIAVVLLLLLGVSLLTGGNHGPGRHHGDVHLPGGPAAPDGLSGRPSRA